MITIRQRRQRISATISQSCGQPIRDIAAATGIPKSSVHRHQQALKQRHQHPESPFWDTGAGDDWLKRLIVAAIYIFGIKRGVGAESLSEFFYTLRIHRHVGISISSLRKIQQILEEKILTYQSEKLTQQVRALKQFKKDHQLKDAPGGIDQFNRQVGDLSAVVDL